MKKKKSGFILFLILSGGLNLFSQQWGLYTFYAPKNGTQAFLIDTANTPVTFKTWTFSSSAKNAYSAYLLPGDTVLRTSTYQASGAPGQGGTTGRIQKVTWDGTVAWNYTYSSTTTQMHHDICPMPNGNVLFISYDKKTATEATQAGASSNAVFWSEKIVEVMPTGPTTGVVVWEWKLWDHLCQNYSSSKDNYVSSIVNNPQLMNINYAGSGNLPDRWHMNGIDYNAELDQIVVSMHFMNSVFVIDHSTTTAQAATHTGGNSGKGGDFLYRWGNPASYGATGTTVFNTIHDAHWVSSDNVNYPNYLAAYNNQGGTSGKTAIDVFQPPYSGYNYTQPAAGSVYAPSTYAYQFNSTFSANNEGNSQQLPNGNILVNNPMGAIYEINSSGSQLWTKASANSSHAYRYTKCYVRAPKATAGASETQINQGAQVTLNSTSTSVTETDQTSTYAWTSTTGFSSIEQNPVLSPTSTGTYTVTVTNAAGCTSTASITINVSTGSELYVTASATPTTVCKGDSVQLNSIAGNGTTYSFEWSSNPAGFTSVLQNPKVAPTENTVYYVTVTSGVSTSSSSVSITVNDLPATPTISQNGNNLVSSASTGNQWYVDGAIIQNATSNSYTAPAGGSYQVMVTDGNGCTAMSNPFPMTVGINENRSNSNQISIYPNPTQNSITLILPESVNSFETIIWDICGKIMLKNNNEKTINLSSLNNGIYFIEIKYDGKSMQRSKIILNK